MADDGRTDDVGVHDQVNKDCPPEDKQAHDRHLNHAVIDTSMPDDVVPDDKGADGGVTDDQATDDEEFDHQPAQDVVADARDAIIDFAMVAGMAMDNNYAGQPRRRRLCGSGLP